MTTTTNPNKCPSQSQTILNVLKQHPGQWVSMVKLWRESGAMAVHSRVAELRRLGFAIENKTERAAPGVAAKVSFYRIYGFDMRTK